MENPSPIQPSISDQPTQTVPVVETKQAKPMYLYVSLGLLLLVLVGGGAFAFSQMNSSPNKTSDQTTLSPTEVPPSPTTPPQTSEEPTGSKTNSTNTGWKKYTNDLQGYSIEYPSNYVVSPHSKKSETFVIYSSQAIPDRQSQYPNNDELELTVWSDQFSTYPPQTRTSLRDYVYKEDHESGLVAANVTWPKINDVEVAKEKMGDTDRYYWLNKGYLYFIDVQPNNTALKSDVNKILASFTFIKPDPNSQVMISAPKLNSPVQSPLTVQGTVPSGWMFEGVVGVQLLDHNDKILAQAQGKETEPGSWQSGKPVEFSAELIFDEDTFPNSLVIIKDNPSGLPENDDKFIWPVRFN